MKTIIFILFIALFASYQASAQTATGSGRKSKAELAKQPVQTAEPLKATVTSGQKNAEVKEVPLETTPLANPTTTVNTSSARRPEYSN